MIARKLLAVGAVVCLLGAPASAADKDDYAKLLVGKWEVTKADEGTAPVGTVIEFTKDGKVNVTINRDGKELTVPATYKLEGKTLTVNMKKGDEERMQTITILKASDTEMETENKDGKKVTMTRKK